LTAFAKKQGWIADLACVLVLASVAFAIGLPRYRVGIDWQDEGFLAYGAVRVMEGQVPNRDFVSLQPPLSFYVAAAIFKLFGTSLGSLRIWGLSIHVLIPLLIYVVSRNFMNCLLSMAAALPAVIMGMPYYGFVPLAVWQGITASLVASALYIPAALAQRRWLAFCAGIVTALSVFLRHDQGLYLCVSIAVLTVALRYAADSRIAKSELKTIFGVWLAGAGVVATALVIFWHEEKALPEMFKQLVVFPMKTYVKTSARPFPMFNAQSPLAQNAMTLLYYVPPVLAGLAAVWIIGQTMHRRFLRREAFLAFLAVWSVLFYCQVLTRSDPVHLLIALPPFFILLTYGWGIFLADFCAKKFVKISSSLIAAAAAVCFLCIVRPVVLPDLTKMNEALELPRGGVRIENGAFLTDLIRRVQSYVPPDRSILALPYEPMFYFLCERRNPTRWNYLWPGDQTLDDHAAFVQQAKNDPPAVVLLNNEKQATSIPAILDYVHHEYRLVQNVSSLSIYVPAQSGP
jgi:hypothetical protein